MRLKMFAVLGVALVSALAFSVYAQSSAGRPQKKKDPITGQWSAVYTIAGTSIPVTLELNLDGKKVTGKTSSEHTGPGTLSQGLWSKPHLSFTMEFERHEPIRVTGTLKDGKLSGDFRTEGMVGSWEAVKKQE